MLLNFMKLCCQMQVSRLPSTSGKPNLLRTSWQPQATSQALNGRKVSLQHAAVLSVSGASHTYLYTGVGCSASSLASPSSQLGSPTDPGGQLQAVLSPPQQGYIAQGLYSPLTAAEQAYGSWVAAFAHEAHGQTWPSSPTAASQPSAEAPAATPSPSAAASAATTSKRRGRPRKTPDPAPSPQLAPVTSAAPSAVPGQSAEPAPTAAVTPDIPASAAASSRERKTRSRRSHKSADETSSASTAAQAPATPASPPPSAAASSPEPKARGKRSRKTKDQQAPASTAPQAPLPASSQALDGAAAGQDRISSSAYQQRLLASPPRVGLVDSQPESSLTKKLDAIKRAAEGGACGQPVVEMLALAVYEHPDVWSQLTVLEAACGCHTLQMGDAVEVAALGHLLQAAQDAMAGATDTSRQQLLRAAALSLGELPLYSPSAAAAAAGPAALAAAGSSPRVLVEAERLSLGQSLSFHKGLDKLFGCVYAFESLQKKVSRKGTKKGVMAAAAAAQHPQAARQLLAAAMPPLVERLARLCMVLPEQGAATAASGGSAAGAAAAQQALTQLSGVLLGAATRDRSELHLPMWRLLQQRLAAAAVPTAAGSGSSGAGPLLGADGLHAQALTRAALLQQYFKQDTDLRHVLNFAKIKHLLANYNAIWADIHALGGSMGTTMANQVMVVMHEAARLLQAPGGSDGAQAVALAAQPPPLEALLWGIMKVSMPMLPKGADSAAKQMDTVRDLFLCWLQLPAAELAAGGSSSAPAAGPAASAAAWSPRAPSTSIDTASVLNNEAYSAHPMSSLSACLTHMFKSGVPAASGAKRYMQGYLWARPDWMPRPPIDAAGDPALAPLAAAWQQLQAALQHGLLQVGPAMAPADCVCLFREVARDESVPSAQQWRAVLAALAAASAAGAPERRQQQLRPALQELSRCLVKVMTLQLLAGSGSGTGSVASADWVAAAAQVAGAGAGDAWEGELAAALQQLAADPAAAPALQQLIRQLRQVAQDTRDQVVSGGNYLLYWPLLLLPMAMHRLLPAAAGDAVSGAPAAAAAVAAELEELRASVDVPCLVSNLMNFRMHEEFNVLLADQVIQWASGGRGLDPARLAACQREGGAALYQAAMITLYQGILRLGEVTERYGAGGDSGDEEEEDGALRRADVGVLRQAVLVQLRYTAESLPPLHPRVAGMLELWALSGHASMSDADMRTAMSTTGLLVRRAQQAAKEAEEQAAAEAAAAAKAGSGSSAKGKAQQRKGQGDLDTYSGLIIEILCKRPFSLPPPGSEQAEALYTQALGEVGARLASSLSG